MRATAATCCCKVGESARARSLLRERGALVTEAKPATAAALGGANGAMRLAAADNIGVHTPGVLELPQAGLPA